MDRSISSLGVRRISGHPLLILLRIQAHAVGPTFARRKPLPFSSGQYDIFDLDDRVFQLVVRLPLPSPVNTVNWAFAGKTKAGSPSTVPPTQTTMLFEERLPDVFLIHIA
jgi:hypothetical protein